MNYPPREHNEHHMFWNRAWYKHSWLRALRNDGLVRNELYIPVHNELHARMSPPPKPSPEMAIGAIGVLRELRDEGFTEPIGVHMALAEHFLGQDSNLSKRLGHHILHQAGYVKEGLLHDIQ